MTDAAERRAKLERPPSSAPSRAARRRSLSSHGGVFFLASSLGCSGAAPLGPASATDDAGRDATSATPIDPNAPRDGGAPTCPLTLRDDPAWNALWPRCPLYYPVVRIGAACDAPRCMRPCLVQVSTGPEADTTVVQRWYWYDDAGRVARSRTFGMGGEIDRTYEYDESGRVTRSVVAGGGGTTYRYDDHGRLTAWARTDPELGPMEQTVQQGPWGPVEVVTTEAGQVIGRQRYVYADDGRIATEEDLDASRFSLRSGDSPVLFELHYDEEGRLDGFRQGDREATVSRDAEGRVQELVRDGRPTAELDYDDAGRLVLVDERAVLLEGYTEYVYDCTGLEPDAEDPAPASTAPPLPPTKPCARPVPKPSGVKTVSDLTPLMVAASHGRRDEVEALVGRGAELDAVDSVLHSSALGLAIGNGWSEVARFLIDKGASVDPSGENEPLRTALYQHRLQAVAWLLAGCADPNRPTRYGRLPLEVAIGQFSIFSNYSGSTSQKQDAREGLEIIRRLLAAGARVDEKPAQAASYEALVQEKFGADSLHPDYDEARREILEMLEAARARR